MRLIKTILAFLIFFLILACGQNPDRQLRSENNDSSVVSMSDDKSRVLQNSEETEEKLVVNDSVIEDGGHTIKEPSQEDTQNYVFNSDAINKPENPEWDWWMVAAITSSVMNVILFLLLIKTVKTKDEYKRQRNDIEIGKNKYKNEVLRLSSKLEELEKKNPNVKGKKKNNLPKHSNSSKKDQSFEDEKSPELILSVNNATVPPPQQEEKQPLILFAEKATENKIFTSVSEQKNEYKSIFKLILDKSESDEAKFEVLDSDYILKMVVNSPDTYLYPVCKPENSNQNYSGEIITTKKGIAHKVDGKWTVKEENKATIKFQ